jgi:hypothetical protein
MSTTSTGGNLPSHRRAAKAGAHMSRRPWEVRESAQKSFKREIPVNSH